MNDYSKIIKEINDPSSLFQIKRQLNAKLEVAQCCIARQVIKRIDARTWKFETDFMGSSDRSLKKLSKFLRSTKKKKATFRMQISFPPE